MFCVCTIAREKERETGREKEEERKRERERDGKRETQKGRKRKRGRGRERETHREKTWYVCMCATLACMRKVAGVHVLVQEHVGLVNFSLVYFT